MSRFPDRQEVLDWIRDNPGAAGKREIARAFGLRGADKVLLKALLRELAEDGEIEGRRKRRHLAGHLPPVTVLVALEPDADGDIFARPKDWEGEGRPPEIRYVPRRGDPALGEGDRFLAKLHPVEDPGRLRYDARLIKRIAAGPRRRLGIYRAGAEGGRLVPIDRRDNLEWTIPPGAAGGARDGELVEAEAMDGPRLGLPRGRIVERLGDPGAPRQVSLIAMHAHGIPDSFPPEVLAEAEAAAPPDPAAHADLTDLPLVTIDPADARDHDDAVCAMADEEPANRGGHVVWVAIADVAAYVRPGSALDREARRRGNSTYFPDRVSPMLPERLSADLCSLVEGEPRPCLAVRMVLNSTGQKISHRFARGIMRSRASLTYEQVQAAADGNPGPEAAPHLDGLAALYAAYEAAARARDARQPLELDLPERRILLDEQGNVTGIPLRERLEAHRLIEEFMILANVCAAETLEAHRRRLIYRVHEEPDPERLDALRETVTSYGLTLKRGQAVRTGHLNDLLRGAQDTEGQELINLQVLRAQAQAFYATENLGHFGLNLARYAHFTSPIRRYADLTVHRALIAALRLGPGGQTAEEADQLAATAEAISRTERRSMEAERDTVDRYVAAYLADREGAEFSGRISGVSRAGLFVRLDETGADGLVPISSLGREFFRHDPDSQTLTGERSGKVYGLGMRARVRLLEAVPATGGLLFELLEATGSVPRPPGPRGRGGKGAVRRRGALDKVKLDRARAKRRERRR